ncbi:RNA 2',3'-cyclic phosphodiesterase [Dyella sp. 2HG41-7]|uniref:RNA 2',3'-cyclic phosphodiesterase n=1 Tax=Dyella sp. 2HG41-7 TaxID=2883239 RepID=UPI002103097C|nr:RNA 2',3'-cyclic phosphodiesterase [Dyella sp. 2HG41-7]
MSIGGSGARQGQILGLPPPTPKEIHRLFFALMPDLATRIVFRDVSVFMQQQHPELRARWVKPERFHATLNFLGDYPVFPQDVVDKASDAAARVHAESFVWTLDYVASFRGREPPCVLRSTHVPDLLLALWRTMHEALAKADLHLRVERQFTPHVTLAYARRALPDATSLTPIEWSVDRFVLIHNIVGKGSYRILGSWPLSKSNA